MSRVTPDPRPWRSVLRYAVLPLLMIAACSKAPRPPELGKAEGLAALGKFEEAEKQLEKLRFRVGIEEQLAKTKERIALYKSTHETIERELRESIAERGENKTLLFARRRAQEEEAAGNRLAAELWRKRMSSISEIAETVRRKDDGQQEDGQVPQDSTPEALGQDWSVFDRELEAVLAKGDYREAVERLRAIMPTAGDDADRFRDKLWAVQKEGRKRIGEIVQRSETIEKKDGPDAALAFLAREGRSFPEFGELGGVEQARRRLLKAMGRADEIPFGPGMGVRVRGEKPRTSENPGPDYGVAREPKDDSSPAPTSSGGDTGSRWRARRVLDKTANRAFDAREYGRAAEEWRAAVKMAEGLVVARVFAARAAEAELMQASLRALEVSIRDEPKRWTRVDLGRGAVAKLVGFEDGRLVAVIRNQREKVALKAIPDRAFAALLLRAAKTPLDRLGAASLYARAFDAKESEQILAKVLKEEPRAKAQIDALLAAVRKEDPGPGGYVLEGSKFVSSREIARRELAAKYRPRFNKLWAAKTDDKRNALLAELQSEGDEVREILVDAVRNKRDSVREALNRSKQAKQLNTLILDRKALEVRRKAALELIFDRVKYFYPYKPPAVSGDKAKEYAPVQMEVDRLCALVREVWDDEGRKVTFSGRLARDLDLYRWLSKALVPLAGESLWREDRYLWALAKKGPTTIRNVARNERERAFVDKCEAVLAENVLAYAKMRTDDTASAAEVELMQRTNAYRHRMGRLPLRADVRIVKAARDHCEEMTRLGYFGHMSPVKSRRTPADRMRLEGYPRGAGENLAINASPAGAIRAWQHSSGHHRNMLTASHRDIGGGVHGRHYNQNFGAGLK